MSHKFASTTAPILQVLKERWSPRAYDASHTLSREDLLPALEAARWAPSAGNSQPTHFVVALRGEAGFERVLQYLTEANARWAKNASALVVNIAEMHNPEGKAMRWAEYDLGQAVTHFSVQAHADGLFVHQMGGFDGEEIANEFGLPEAQHVVTVMAVGVTTDPENVDLAEHHHSQELGERARRELTSFVTFV